MRPPLLSRAWAVLRLALTPTPPPIPRARIVAATAGSHADRATARAWTGR